uniref:Sulfite reductase [NADPH] flavoprotein alpha-component n=1 Tax=uncultured Thiotrichaceae bacterium TaxID=298394 RepID=A0A6S6T918_9GAMM|nr:MAG: Sulfite reductase [NADPH] flavoprotein alpha-component (EC [uncultured Thiotrichaceae bacterium]
MSLLNEQQFGRISSAVNELTPAQLAWVGGYLSGLSLGDSGNSNNIIPFPQQVQTTPEVQTAISTTILYGSQTGNSRGIAEKLQQQLEAAGHATQLKSLRDYRPQQLKKEQRVAFVISTHGNGEPPDDAIAFFRFINSTRAPKLNDLDFAVLALGDSSYEEYCQTGVELDQRLEALGGTRWLERIDCDVDFAEDAASWRTQVFDKADNENKPADNTLAFQQAPLTSAVQQAAVGTIDSPWNAELLSFTPVTDVDSYKDVLHFEFSLEDSGITYQPGDILAVNISNDADLVDALLTQAQLAADTEVSIKNKPYRLHDALLSKLEITSLTRRQLQAYAKQTQHPELEVLAADKTALVDWLEATDWIDVLREYPAPLDAQALVDLLRPLKAREYSIASSLEAHPDEVHLLVKRVEYQQSGRKHLGAGSNWLARLQEANSASVYIKPNTNFRLPDNDETKVIMIGAGTGVAPFRSFLSEREAKGIEGNSWLFFGEQHFRSEFIYQAEWLQHMKAGVLERMDVAFSRDQAEKIYVQHRMLEQAESLWAWLNDGAHIYVCGDMHKMAKDVHNALLQIAVEQGGQSNEQAEQWLEQLITDKRYQRDIY